MIYRILVLKVLIFKYIYGTWLNIFLIFAYPSTTIFVKQNVQLTFNALMAPRHTLKDTNYEHIPLRKNIRKLNEPFAMIRVVTIK